MSENWNENTDIKNIGIMLEWFKCSPCTIAPNNGFMLIKPCTMLCTKQIHLLGYA